MPGSIAVVGTIFVDCKGFSRYPYTSTGRNQGRIQVAHGGVARNVAENLALMDVPTTFVSTVDATGIGRDIITRLKKSNVNITYMIETPEGGMGMWLAIVNEKGALAGSISQMPDLTHLSKLLDQRGSEVISKASHLVLELDLSEEITRKALEWAREAGKPVYGIAGNLEVIRAHPDLLQPLECFICNYVDAEQLLGTPLHSMKHDDILFLLKEYVHQTGLRMMVITLGPDGSIYYDSRSGDAGCQPALPVRPLDISGAGDAFFAGTVMGLIRGLPLREAVLCGTKIAAWTIQSPDNTCPTLRDHIREDEFFRVVVG